MLGSEGAGSAPRELFGVGSGSSPLQCHHQRGAASASPGSATWGRHQHLAMGTGHTATLRIQGEAREAVLRKQELFLMYV